ncbi:class I SAM-dependent methyltransferase [Cyanobium gracile UHCC 0139]|uniref:Class I SAM-dependent methyltransferase n=1 Tax=Cyanobium gracile UHCC 0139 TaxID=3110308 RepID=A0ABU5RUK5_9CYAN|nr:class I SAM-dependent methyltransferase [Cyanobium gracile]MEA5391431.1 class I SAM-dependent methyltransferase [Cyanobium gracile UHCC 0139]
MGEASWDHGYHSSTSYTSAFYRELSPSWLDFAALLKGQLPPRDSEGEPFTFLDLGCGTGFSLVMLAALYPEGHFYGVDFHPDHVAHALDLVRRAGLNNVVILEADFLELADSADSWPWPPGGCHYVAAHGIATWVTEPVQSALLSLAAASLRPGGLFYCSYNAYPGWLARSSFQQLLALELPTARPGELGRCFHESASLLIQLLGEDAQPSPLGSALPGLRRELQSLQFAPVDYLCGEFANAGWSPLYVTEMLARCQKHKLSFLGSATYSETLVELLPPTLRDRALRETRPVARELLIDLATNKAFRRDLLVRGHVRLTQQEWGQRLASLSFCLLLPQPEWLPTPRATLHFRSSFGEIQGDPKAYGPVLAGLSAAPMSLASLLSTAQQSQGELVVMLALLLEAGSIGFERGPAGATAAPLVQRLNQVLLDRMQEGRSYTQLALPAAASALPFSILEALIHKALLERLEEPMLSSCVLLWLQELDVQLLSQDNQVITDPQAQIDRIQAITAAVVATKQPLLQRLGGLPGPSLSQSRSGRRRSKAPGPPGV